MLYGAKVLAESVHCITPPSVVLRLDLQKRHKGNLGKRLFIYLLLVNKKTGYGRHFGSQYSLAVPERGLLYKDHKT